MSAFTVDRLIGLGLIWGALATFVVVGIYRLGKRNGSAPRPDDIDAEFRALCREIEW